MADQQQSDQGPQPSNKPGSIHKDLDTAMDELEMQISKHINNSVFRDIALHAVEMVRKIVDAHVKV